MIADRSASVNRAFGVRRVSRLLERSRSSVYWRRAAPSRAVRFQGKRGPKPAINDERLVEAIRTEIAASPFSGEGHRKVWARLRLAGIRTSKRRVLCLMRTHGLLAPTRCVRELGPRVHDGTIVTEAPNVMWGTDATAVWTVREGLVTVFAAIDHATAECLGIHAAKNGTRFEALEPLRQGVRATFGAYGVGVASGLKLRHDHGSQYMSDHFQREIAFLGIESSPAFVRSPEGNGVVERFFRTLKEQLLWTRRFEDAEDVRAAVRAWAAIYNERWLVERLGHRSPAQARRDMLAFKKSA